MLLTSAKLDHKKTTEKEDKPAKIKSKKKGEKPKQSWLNTDLTSDKTSSKPANAQMNEMTLIGMLDLIYVLYI